MFAPPPVLGLVVIRSKDIERAKTLYLAIGLPMRLEAVEPRDLPGGRQAVVADFDGHHVELFTPARDAAPLPLS